MRKKTCPHCRAVVRERPVEVWGVKGIAQSVGNSGLAPIQIPVPTDPPESLNANSDPWKDIFPKARGAGHPHFPWFFPGADIGEDDDIPNVDIAQSGEDVGMLDMEDGGIYRCLDCMHEIWDGICTSCGRVYPGHRHDVDDDEDDEDDEAGAIWFDHQMVAEHVDMRDDPGWMGLEGGNGDDDGDDDQWSDHLDAPWRRRMHMFGGLIGIFGAVDVEGTDNEEVDVGSGDEEVDGDEVGYESSFIDDEDDVRIVDIEDGRPRIYEISDDSDSQVSGRRQPLIDIASDDHEDEGYHVHERRLVGSTRTALVILSDESEDEPESDLDLRRPWLGGGGGGPSRGGRLRRGRAIIESDGSDAEFSSDA
jgi:hypothetical protein